MDLESNWAFVEYEARSISATYIRSLLCTLQYSVQSTDIRSVILHIKQEITNMVAREQILFVLRMYSVLHT